VAPDAVCLTCWDGYADGPAVERLAGLVAGEGTGGPRGTAAERAVQALGEVGDPRARPALLACLDHPVPSCGSLPLAASAGAGRRPT
jgi:hypothetical protein